MNKHKGYTPLQLFFLFVATGVLAVGIFAVWVMWHFIERYW